MPPKRKVDKGQILQEAFQFCRVYGFEQMSARALARALGCSTQPIYQAFGDMQRLKQALAVKGFSYMLTWVDALNQQQQLAPPVGMAYGYVCFALEERHLYRLIAQCGLFAQSIGEEAAAETIPEELIIFANGLVYMLLFGTFSLTRVQILEKLQSAHNDFCR